MSKYFGSLCGARGRTILIYDMKCEIVTDVTVGSVITQNATDGRKTIFYKDCIGVQFKCTGLLIGYLQFETGNVQMNNLASNSFSENTFTFENKNGLSNEIMTDVYHFLVDIIEGFKYNSKLLINTPIPKSLIAMWDTPDLRELMKEREQVYSREFQEAEKERLETEKEDKKAQQKLLDEKEEIIRRKNELKQERLSKGAFVFIFSEHAMTIESMKNAKEIAEYIQEIDPGRSFFTEEMLKELNNIVQMEKLYGNMKRDAINYLKSIE